MEACISFEKKDYGKCLSLLSKLSIENPESPSLELNKSLLEFIHTNEYCKVDEFQLNLERIAVTLERNQSIDNLKLSHKTSPTLCVLYYNLSLCYFYQRNYSSVINFLLKFFNLTKFYLSDTESLETLCNLTFPICKDLVLSWKMMLLFLDSLLRIKSYKKLYAISGYLLRSSHLLSSLIFPNHYRNIIKVFAIKALISLGYGDAADHEIDELLSNRSNDKSQDFPINDLLLLKSRILIYRGSINEAISCLNNIEPRENVEDPKVTGILEYPIICNNLGVVNGMHRKFELSSRHFSKSVASYEHFSNEIIGTDKSFTDSISSYTNGPLSRKSNLNSLNKIFKNMSSKKIDFQLNSHINLKCLNISSHMSVLYNYGLSSLFAKKFGTAFEVFQKLIQIYPNNPRIWFRLAEACYKINISLGETYDCSKADMKFETIPFCNQERRKLFIKYTSSKESPKPWVESAIFSTPSLDLASLALKNAIHCIFSSSESFVLSSDFKNYSNSLLEWAENKKIQTDPSTEVLYGLKLLHFCSSCFLFSAYTSLCLNNYYETILYASQIIFESECEANDEMEELFSLDSSPLDKTMWLGNFSSANHRYLAKSYAAEACYHLKKYHLAQKFAKYSLSNFNLNRDPLKQNVQKRSEIPSFLLPNSFRSSLNVNGPPDPQNDDKSKWKKSFDHLSSSQIESISLFNQAIIELTLNDIDQTKSTLDVIQGSMLKNSLVNDFPNRFSYLKLMAELTIENTPSTANEDRPQGTIGLGKETKKLLTNFYGNMARKDKIFR